MTRINNTGVSGPQQIPSQDSGTQQVSKNQPPKTQQEPNAAEQQQGKQAAQGRKSDIDLQGNLKQSELAQFHGPGGSHRNDSLKEGLLERMKRFDSKKNISNEQLEQMQKNLDDAAPAIVVSTAVGAFLGGTVGAADMATAEAVQVTEKNAEVVGKPLQNRKDIETLRK